MELLQLYYFKALAEREHLTQTAQSLMIAAPTLSATISRLEKEFGVQLFDRVGRNIRLNENGRILLKYVNEIFNSLHNARTELRDANDRSQKRVTVAVTAESLWTRAIHDFLEAHPDILVQHETLKLDELNQDTICAQYDFVITAQRDLSDKDYWVYSLLYNDWPVVVFNQKHTKLLGRESIDLSELKDENFVVLSKGYSSRRWFDETCAAAGFKPNIAVECDYQLRTEMLRANYGLGFSSVLGQKSNILSEFEYVRLASPIVARTQVIAWDKRRKLSGAALTFHSFMVEYMKKFGGVQTDGPDAVSCSSPR